MDAKMEAEDALGGAGDGAGTVAPRRAGAWNIHDERAVAGILAAARASGATGASVKYGTVVTKVFFGSQGSEDTKVKDKTSEVQLATMQARLDELQRCAAGASSRAQKEKLRKQKQKAAKKEKEQEQRREQ